MSEPPESVPQSRTARLMLAALVALGLLARLALALMMGDAQATRLPESSEYLAIGRSAADGDGFMLPGRGAGPAATRHPGPDAEKGPVGPAEFARRMPGYPALIAAANRMTSAPLRTVLVVQAVCGGLALGLAAWAAARLAGLWAGLVAVALLAFDPYRVYFAALAVPVTPVGLALAAAMALGLKFIAAVESGSCRAWVWGAATGLTVAAAAYFEPWAVGLVVPIGVAAAVARERRRFLAGWAAGAAVLLVCLAPWLIRNTVRLGVPILTTLTGERLFEGTLTQRGLPLPSEKAREAEGLDEVGQDVFYLRSALGEMADAPAQWLKLAALRVGRLWSPGPILEGGDEAIHPAAGYTSLLPTAALALVGVWMLRRQRATVVWLLLAPLWLTCVHAVLASPPPERLEVMPALAVLGGAGLMALVGRRSAPHAEAKAS